MKSSKRSKVPKVVAGSIATTGLLFVGIFGLIFQQDIRDTVEGFSYTPTRTVEEIQARIGITPKGERVFHATAPSVVGAEEFNKECPRQEQASPIVGCYKPNDSIYIYDVANESLSGMREVTAAHELLHAVWRRMSTAQQEQIGVQLQRVYERTATEAFEDRMAYYERTQKGQELNELHSILGTEERELTPELEAHYAQYFDRKAVVALYEGYQEYYDSLQATVTSLQKKLDRLAVTISDDNTSYLVEASQLEAKIRSFNARAQNGSFSSQQQFSAERYQLEREVARLDARRAAVNDAIKEYNDMYREYRDVGAEIQALNNSIDSFKTLKEPSQLQQL